MVLLNLSACRGTLLSLSYYRKTKIWLHSWFIAYKVAEIDFDSTCFQSKAQLLTITFCIMIGAEAEADT